MRAFGGRLENDPEPIGARAQAAGPHGSWSCSWRNGSLVEGSALSRWNHGRNQRAGREH
jgi:hypothetical protein